MLNLHGGAVHLTTTKRHTLQLPRNPAIPTALALLLLLLHQANNVFIIVFLVFSNQFCSTVLSNCILCN